jgi:hypothetical protein
MVKKVGKKKTTSKRKPATADSTALPSTASVPEGFKTLGGGYAESWKPEDMPELRGIITGEVREVEFKQGRKTVQRRVCEVTATDTDKRYSVWESAALGSFMDAVADGALGKECFLRFDGLGKAKTGQNAPKLFTVAIAE